MKLSDLFLSYNLILTPNSEIALIPIYLSNLERINQWSTKEPEKEPIEEKEEKEIEVKKEIPIKSTITPKNLWMANMIAAYKKIGLPDIAIKNLIAKNALESGWGRSAQGKYNYGNITAGNSWTGNYVKGRDKNAAGLRISLKFRSYNSLDDYVQDEILFLTKLYDFNPNDSFDIFIAKLQGQNKGKRSYAESPTYARDVRNVYNSIQ